ncbi:MAG: HNH endonuclease [Micavibrio aeruginosavorus]|uniref:HNH endonuclease n=1 Tax=Micavibrio aeruginosavorus TaxID=349221 RepID=A0A7T5UGN4_9BACT|nr:MAG: HNH endonuclease [Micavibrio aeruginosavorus]
MKFLPITLGIARASANAQSSLGGRDSAKLSPEVRQKILERDGQVCACCGFQSAKYQEVLHINGNPNDARPENLRTVCIFCHQCFNLDQVALMRSGVLIWLPEIGQADLHHIVRAIYVARISQGPIADAARRSLDVFMQRREDARRRLGTDDPFILSSVMKDYISSKTCEGAAQKLEGLRLFPLDRRIIKEADLEFNQFPQILAYWRSKDGPFGGTLPRQWIDIYKSVLPPSKAA